jgi:hypothetical protein
MSKRKRARTGNIVCPPQAIRRKIKTGSITGRCMLSWQEHETNRVVAITHAGTPFIATLTRADFMRMLAAAADAFGFDFVTAAARSQGIDFILNLNEVVSFQQEVLQSREFLADEITPLKRR